MNIRPIALSLLVIALTSSTNPPDSERAAQYVSNYENVLGTSLELKFAARSEQQAVVAEKAALSEIDRLNGILSSYQASSEFRRWTATRNVPVKVSPELFDVLALYDRWKMTTGGALDASAEVIGKVWKSASVRHQLPAADELAAAVTTVKQRHWVLDASQHTATHLDDAPLMLNSFTKSFIMDRASRAAIRAGGVSTVVMNIGGDILVSGARPEKILVADPKADAENDAPMSTVLLANKTIATSGNYRRGEMINGHWYSHIVDPRNGKPVDQVISATVVASRATDAGALATAFNVLSPAESQKLAASIPGTDYLLVLNNGKKIESAGWKALQISETPSASIPEPAVSMGKDKTWDPKYELTIGLNLRQIEGMRVQRPFVAIWVTDKDSKPVRNISLWYRQPRYLNELRTWYAAYYRQLNDASTNVSSTTSATRSAGSYTVKWDGKNDKGEYVKLGTYTIHIEIAREHGTYQVMTQDLDFTKSVTPVSLAGNPEVESASLAYAKKADGQ